MYKIGDRVAWHAINRDYSGEVTGFRNGFAVVRIDGTDKVVLMGEKQFVQPNNCREKDAAR